jgi:hypothetical protein
MAHKPKTPEELARSRAGKKSYSLYLNAAAMDEIKKIATDQVSVSEIVDEAISSYLRSVKRQR